MNDSFLPFDCFDCFAAHACSFSLFLSFSPFSLGSAAARLFPSVIEAQGVFNSIKYEDEQCLCFSPLFFVSLCRLPTPARFACFAAPIAIHTSFFPLTRTPPSFPFLFCFCFCSPPFHCCLFVLRFNPVAATKMEKALQSMCTTVKFDVRATRMLLHTAHVPPFPFLCVVRCILCWMCVRVCCDFDMRMLCGGVCCVVFAVFAVRHLGLR